MSHTFTKSVLDKSATNLHEFIVDERSKCSKNSEGDNFFLLFSEVEKYFGYLSIIWPRYEEASKTFIVDSKEAFSHSARENTNLEVEELLTADEKYAKTLRLQAELHLELENIFIYTSILLDRLAGATGYYFGSTNTLNTFYNLKENFTKFSVTKKLITTNTFTKKTEWLYENVTRFRNKLLVHKHEKDYYVRHQFGVGYSTQLPSEAYFGVYLVYPTKREAIPIQSEKPSTIFLELTQFMEIWLKLLEVNRTKRKQI